jgi:glycosyltransferase involved in cell wall biosynthesis
VGGVADLVTHEETGWLVPSGDPDAMASAIRRLLSDRLLGARLAAAGQVAALDRHDVTRLVSCVDALYTGVMDEKRATGNTPPISRHRG